MSSKTTNFNLHKIDLTDAPPDITVLNQNWDALDEKLNEIDTTMEAFQTDYGALRIIVGLDAIGLVDGQETILDIASRLPLNSMFIMTVTSGHKTSEYPYQTGTLIATKTISTRVTYEYIDNNGIHYSGTVRGSGESATWLGWIKNPTKASDISALTIGNDRIDIPEGADLNSDEYLKIGAWRATTVARATSLTNCPVQIAFTMDIVAGTGFHTEVGTNNGYIIQKINTNTGEQYFRRIYAGSNGRVIDDWQFVYSTGMITYGTSDKTAGSASTAPEKSIYFVIE